MPKDILWRFAALGNSAGMIKIHDKSMETNDRTGSICLQEGCHFPEPIEIISTKGKLADSEDSFLFLYCGIDPMKENFALSATFQILPSEELSDNQTGFGIMALDTVFSPADSRESDLCRHRNHLLLGRFRTIEGRNHGYGLRAVGGHMVPEAQDYQPGRMLDPTRTFSYQEKEDSLLPGDRCTFSLKKTDKGFIAVLKKDEIEETILFPGCDFLMKQDEDRVYIGFAVAGKVRIEISDVDVKIMEGKVSKTPGNAIVCEIPDYPFPRTLFDANEKVNPGKRKKADKVLYVSPDGTKDQDGTKDSPMDLGTALQSIGESSEIVLLDGVYRLKEPIYLPSQSGGSFQKRSKIRALHTRNAILDGAQISVKSPLLIIRGWYWLIEGLVIQNSPLSGIMVCGNGNFLCNCETRHNGDTGILICAYPGTNRDDWPSYNQIEDCDSYDNCDSVRCNADGFGAKLSLGKGNRFYRCIAHHNIDDGFDLYTKSIIGPTNPVILEKCIAYENGKTLEDQFVRKNHTGGTGFKLGGENQPVRHELWDCMALLNQQYGFSSNSNPAVSLHHCTSLYNGSGKKEDNYCFYSHGEGGEPIWILEDLLPAVSRDGRVGKIPFKARNMKKRLEKGSRPIRKNDGSIDISGLTGFREERGVRQRGAIIEDQRQRTILMLIASLGGGGAERVTTILASEFSRKYSVHLYYMCRKEQSYPISPKVHLIDGSWSNGTPLEKYFHLGFRWPFRLYSIWKAKRKYHVDVTVSMLYKPNLYNGWIHWKDRRIMSERNDPSRKPEKEYRDMKRSFPKADHVVFQSKRVQGMFDENVQKKSYIIRNPIAVSCFADLFPYDRIVTVGRYISQKNHKMLIKAFALFHHNHPSYTLHLYGEGELRNSLEELIEELQLQDTVFLEGFREDIHEQIKHAKMFVLSSDYEGMSNALMEAMMMGLPCISTACTGSDELLDDGKTGLLVPLDDAEAMAVAMEKLADDEGLREKLRRYAQLASLEFEKKKVIRDWERIMFR